MGVITSKCSCTHDIGRAAVQVLHGRGFVSAGRQGGLVLAVRLRDPDGHRTLQSAVRLGGCHGTFNSKQIRTYLHDIVIHSKSASTHAKKQLQAE